MTASLFLIPAPLGDTNSLWLPEGERQRILHLCHFVVETEKVARKHLKILGLGTSLRELTLATLNEHTPPNEISTLLSPIASGYDIGLLSDAGCPAIADPGALLVAQAHQREIPVIPLIGPSSLFLALMASGAHGQCFAFHGYLPIPLAERMRTIKGLEQRSRQNKETQILIETPYRNQALIAQLRTHLAPSTRLTVACDLTLPTQHIVSRRVSDWPTSLPDFHKRPAIIIIDASQITH